MDKKKLREGVTTGACAAAAAKAAVLMLQGRQVGAVSLLLPGGEQRNFQVAYVKTDGNKAEAAVRKDAGDDPDVTHGILVVATATWQKQKGISLSGGPGIGTVTKKGLKVPVGEKAINPAPRQMILSAVRGVVSGGVHIEISVPEGEGIAKKTMNASLGIQGGISILGTTGIVKPMSLAAMKDSILLNLRVIKENYLQPEMPVILVFGNIGKGFAREKLAYPDGHILTVSNFLGPVLDEIENLNIRQVILLGHIGKVVKVSAGIFQTHSKIADARMETLCAYTALSGGNRQLCQKIYDCNTTDEAVQYLQNHHMDGVFEMVAQNAKKRIETRCFHQVVCRCIVFGQQETVLADTY